MAHREDVEYIQAHYPEVAEFLAEMTKEFGPLEYRVTLGKSRIGEQVEIKPLRRDWCEEMRKKLK